MRKISLILLVFFCSYYVYAEVKIYPSPQKINYSSQKIQLTNIVNLVFADDIEITTRERLTEVLAKANIRSKTITSPIQNETNIIIGNVTSIGIVHNYLIDRKITVPSLKESEHRFDAHCLQINKSNKGQGDILILGNGKGSAYYAMATLSQILEQSKLPELACLKIEDYAYTKCRGIVEGFYGHPYSLSNKLSLLEYCKRYKLNTYVYGPKSDPYHLGKWREKYPVALNEEQMKLGWLTQEDMKILAEKAKRCHVNFVWAIHPALENGIQFSNERAIDKGVGDIMKKLNHMYELGIRDFGVFIDDMSYTPSGKLQAYLANEVQKALKKQFDGSGKNERVGNLFFVPTAYALNYGSSYTLNALKEVSSEVEIMFTGHNCFSDLRESAFLDIKKRIGRNALMWWNNPVNDDKDAWLYLHGISARWKMDKKAIETMGGLLLNPMNQAQSSKIALFEAADYSWNPIPFQASRGWNDALQSLFLDSSFYADFKVFAEMVSSYPKTGDGEKYAPIYQSFIEEYTKFKLPEITEELYKLMNKTYQSCLHLEELEHSTIKEDQLLFQEILPWLLKVKKATYIVSSILEYKLYSETGEEWSNLNLIYQEISHYHTDKKTQVSALEGSGTTTHEVFYEAHPTPNGLDKLVDFLKNHIYPCLPQREKVPVIITNSNLKEIFSLEEKTKGFCLSGLNQIELNPNEYIGICFNAIKKITPTFITSTKELLYQYSMNGKKWIDFQEGHEFEAAYCRFINRTNTIITLDSDEWSFPLPSIAPIEIAKVSTNMPTYQNYSVQRLTDKNKSSFFWSSRGQQVGDYILFEFKSPCFIDQVICQFNKNDQPSGSIFFQFSDDKITWKNCGILGKEQIDDDCLCQVNIKKRKAKCFRFYIESVASDSWMQIAEISFKQTSEDIPICITDEGDNTLLFVDSDLETYFSPKKAGSLIYQLIENKHIEEINIYHQKKTEITGKNPIFYVYSKDKWQEIGQLKGDYSSFNMIGYPQAEKIKITWFESYLPKLHDIVVKGTPYVASSIEENHILSTGKKYSCFFLPRKINIQTQLPIVSYRLYDEDSQLLRTASVFTTKLELSVSLSGFYLLVFTLNNGEVFHCKAVL